ncbi:MAG TPA: amidohydrolase family protein [Longimicrobiales bacterium]
MHRHLLIAAVFLGAGGAAAQDVPASWTEPGVVAFVGVNVVPMDSERVIADQTVVVRDGRIAAMGPSAGTTVPEGATRVDARGKYLIPGLAEMHGHVPAQATPFQEDVLFLYVAAGVTTVRGMQGHPNHLPLRERVRSGELIGPHLYLSSPPFAGMGGNALTDPDTARARVRAARAAGYDHLKVHEGLSPEVYDAIAETAHAENFPFGGHVSDAVGLERALAARQTTIDHLDNYIDALQRDGSPALTMTGAARGQALPLNVDEAKIPDVVRATREAGVANVPTMALWEVLRGSHSGDQLASREELRYIPKQMVDGWVQQVNGIHAGWDPAAAEAEREVRKRILEALHDGGAPILMGTDAPQLFSVPGFSLHRELPVMVEAGMTPFEVLQTGTVNIARFYGEEDEAGTVAVGRRADLVLLDANPLDEIDNVQKVSGVMVAGRWLDATARQARLDAIAQRAAGA